MTYTLEADHNQRIIISTLSSDFDVHAEVEPYIMELKSLLDQMDGPAVYISDVRNYDVNFSDLTGILGIITRGDMAILKHKNLRKTIVVTSSGMVRMGVNALGQNQYGALRTAIHMSLEDAVADATRELAAT